MELLKFGVIVAGREKKQKTVHWIVKISALIS